MTAWPSGVAVPYMLAPAGVAGGPGAVALATGTGLAVALHRPRTYPEVGWLWFVGMLVPACGLAQTGT